MAGKMQTLGFQASECSLTSKPTSIKFCYDPCNWPRPLSSMTLHSSHPGELPVTQLQTSPLTCPFQTFLYVSAGGKKIINRMVRKFLFIMTLKLQCFFSVTTAFCITHHVCSFNPQPDKTLDINSTNLPFKYIIFTDTTAFLWLVSCVVHNLAESNSEVLVRSIHFNQVTAAIHLHLSNSTDLFVQTKLYRQASFFLMYLQNTFYLKCSHTLAIVLDLHGLLPPPSWFNQLPKPNKAIGPLLQWYYSYYLDCSSLLPCSIAIPLNKFLMAHCIMHLCCKLSLPYDGGTELLGAVTNFISEIL